MSTGISSPYPQWVVRTHPLFRDRYALVRMQGKTIVSYRRKAGEKAVETFFDAAEAEALAALLNSDKGPAVTLPRTVVERLLSMARMTAENGARDPFGGPGDRVMVCDECGQTEGHYEDCPIEIAERALTEVVS